MIDYNIEKEIVEIFNDNFKNSRPILINLTFNDIDEWDSMGFTVIISVIESRFNLNFELEDMLEFDSVKSICDAVLRIKVENI